MYFDAQSTDRRADAVRRAIAAGKDVYCEKPSAATLAEALEPYRLAREAGVRHGVVQDKLWLPGIVALRGLMESGFFARLLSVRGEFGYWVFEGDEVTPQRPSWNYRREDGGGIIADMFAHWRYVLDEVFGAVTGVSCVAATHVPQRWDEQGRPYACTAEDAACATFQLEGGAIAHFNSSWTVRVRRDDLLTIQVDGTKGSAVAGLRRCWAQPAAATPRPVWNPDEDAGHDYRSDWREVPSASEPENAFRAQWELFLRHVACGDPFPWDLLAGARHAAATSFLALFSIVGLALYGLPLFYDHMVREFGWSRTMVTSGNALSKLAVGPLFGFIAGWLIDRFGPRRFMLAGVLMAGVALAGLGGMSAAWMFDAFYLLNALGYVCGGPLPNQVLP